MLTLQEALRVYLLLLLGLVLVHQWWTFPSVCLSSLPDLDCARTDADKAQRLPGMLTKNATLSCWQCVAYIVKPQHTCSCALLLYHLLPVCCRGAQHCLCFPLC